VDFYFLIPWRWPHINSRVVRHAGSASEHALPRRLQRTCFPELLGQIDIVPEGRYDRVDFFFRLPRADGNNVWTPSFLKTINIADNYFEGKSTWLLHERQKI